MAPLGKLYTYANNPRAFKALIAAKYAGVELDLPAFQFGVTNKEDWFVQKFPFGKVPAFETADGHALSESNAIAHYVAASSPKSNLFGTGPLESALVQMFINVADNDITPAAATWIYPLLHYVPYNAQNTNKAKEDLKATFAALNKVLETRTYLVGERITLADIHVVVSLVHLYQLVLDPEFRAPYPNLNRYFVTMVNQPHFVSVIGKLELCVKAQVYEPQKDSQQKSKKEEKKPKEEKKQQTAQPPKEEKPAPKAQPEEEEEEEDYQDEKPKGKNPLDLLPPSKFVLDAFKRFYSNNEEEAAIAHFWETFDPEGFSIWRCSYKYNEENTQIFKTSNLLGGFFQRLDHARKYAFGSFIIFGEDNANEIHGIFVFRGQDIPKEVQEAADFESYTFTKYENLEDSASRQDINAFLAWKEVGVLAKFNGITKPVKDGKNFK